MRNTSSKQKSASKKKQIVKISLLLFVFAVAVGLLVDLKRITQKKVKTPAEAFTQELNDVLLEQKMVEYKDKKGLFTLSIPKKWIIEPQHNMEKPYNVMFRAPSGCDITVTTSKAPKMSFERLKRDIKHIQSNYGLNMNVEEIQFNGFPAIKRTVLLHYSTILVIDFLQNGLAHEIQLSVPHRFNQQAQEILMGIVETYRSGTP